MVNSHTERTFYRCTCRHDIGALEYQIAEQMISRIPPKSHYTNWHQPALETTLILVNWQAATRKVIFKKFSFSEPGFQPVHVATLTTNFLQHICTSKTKIDKIIYILLCNNNLICLNAYSWGHISQGWLYVAQVRIAGCVDWLHIYNITQYIMYINLETKKDIIILSSSMSDPMINKNYNC